MLSEATCRHNRFQIHPPGIGKEVYVELQVPQSLLLEECDIEGVFLSGASAKSLVDELEDAFVAPLCVDCAIIDRATLLLILRLNRLLRLILIADS